MLGGEVLEGICLYWWQSLGSLLINFFCGSKKVWSAGSSVGIDQPTGHAIERAGRRPFCRFFRLKSEKILLAKMGQAGKNFRGSKIFDG